MVRDGCIRQAKQMPKRDAGHAMTVCVSMCCPAVQATTATSARQQQRWCQAAGCWQTATLQPMPCPGVIVRGSVLLMRLHQWLLDITLQ